ncbi:YetF domain-containing protein [Peribacillus sp. NPDC096448]|uniref:YetF domain-containing protein n=1 Tax=Peribacillus sp. NPDC096448 TaxID=3364395 RepID=UPI003810C644
MTPPDLAAIVFVVTLSVSPIKANGIGQAIAGIIIIVLMYLLFSKLSLFRRLNRIFIGHPSILIKHGKVSKKDLRKTRFSLVELLSTIRASGRIDKQRISPNQ